MYAEAQNRIVRLLETRPRHGEVLGGSEEVTG